MTVNISVGSVGTCFKTVCVCVKIVRKFPASVRTLKAVSSVKNHYSRYRQFGNLQEVLHVFNNEGLDNKQSIVRDHHNNTQWRLLQ